MSKNFIAKRLWSKYIYRWKCNTYADFFCISLPSVYSYNHCPSNLPDLSQHTFFRLSCLAVMTTFQVFLTLFCCFSNFGLMLSLERLLDSADFLILSFWREKGAKDKSHISQHSLIPYLHLLHQSHYVKKVFSFLSLLSFLFGFFLFCISLNEIARVVVVGFDWQQKGPAFHCLGAGLGCAHCPTFLFCQEEQCLWAVKL